MASTRCHACMTRTVRIAGDVCATCSSNGALKINKPAEAELPPMSASEPRELIEVSLRQARRGLELVQAVMDTPRLLLCAGCHENATATEQVNLTVVLDSMVKNAKVLSAVIPVWSKLVKDATEAAEQMSREEMTELFKGWYQKLPAPTQREMLHALTQIHNERAAQPTYSILGSKA